MRAPEEQSQASYTAPRLNHPLAGRSRIHPVAAAGGVNLQVVRADQSPARRRLNMTPVPTWEDRVRPRSAADTLRGRLSGSRGFSLLRALSAMDSHSSQPAENPSSGQDVAVTWVSCEEMDRWEASPCDPDAGVCSR